MSAAYQPNPSVRRIESISVPVSARLNVRALRRRLGVTTAELALTTQVMPRRLRAFETGRGNLNAVELRALAKGLGVRIFNLFEVRA